MATGCRNWDVTRTLTIEELTDQDLPELVRGRGIESLEIEFRATGFYQPASMYGGPDHLGWPAEGADDREMVSVSARGYEGYRIELTIEEQRVLFDAFKARVDEADLDLGEE